MKDIRWSRLKSERLKLTRGISFEEVVQGRLIDVLSHPKQEHQRILVYDCKGYVWAVPYVNEGDYIFLKTIYPSRKLRKIYQKR